MLIFTTRPSRVCEMQQMEIHMRYIGFLIVKCIIGFFIVFGIQRIFVNLDFYGLGGKCWSFRLWSSLGGVPTKELVIFFVATFFSCFLVSFIISSSFPKKMLRGLFTSIGTCFVAVLPSIIALLTSIGAAYNPSSGFFHGEKYPLSFLVISTAISGAAAGDLSRRLYKKEFTNLTLLIGICIILTLLCIILTLLCMIRIF